MKQWLLLILILTLVACNNNDVEDEQNSQNDGSNPQEIEDNQDQNHTEKSETPPNTEEIKEEEPETEPEPQPEVVEPQYELNNIWSVKPISDANEKVVLLTIDDAPDKYALEMAKTLKDLDAKAIFFVNGHFLQTEKQKDWLKQIHEMGFEIGNHTFNHPYLWQNKNGVRYELPEEEQREEIVSLSNLIEEIIGERPKFFRAPYGHNTDYSNKLAKEEGMLVMNWSFGYDWNQNYMTEESLADIMVNTNLLGKGANLLMHDREWTAAALDDIVKGLREKGYEIVDPDLIKTP